MALLCLERKRGKKVTHFCGKVEPGSKPNNPSQTRKMPAPQSRPTAREADELMGGGVGLVLRPRPRLLRPPSYGLVCFAPEIAGLPGRKGKRKQGGSEKRST